MRKSVTLVCYILFFLSLILIKSSVAVTMEDAIGLWLFDDGKGDTAADSSKNGQKGKLMNNPTWVDGKFGKALSFDVEGPFVRIEVPSINLTSWSAMAWINPKNPKSGHYQGVIQAWPNQGEFQIDPNGGIGVHPVYGGTLKEKEWAHVAVIVTNNNVNVYINGKVVIQGPVGAVTFVKIGIGDLYEVPAGFNYKFSGIVDEVAIFNKAIAENDVQDIMNKGIGKVFGIIAVSTVDKITATWGNIKNYR
jgi:hypothetical protein